MRIAVLGAGGQLGNEFIRRLGAAATALHRSDADITDAESVERALASRNPDAVVNCAAFNLVDAAETERETALAANFRAPRQLARVCRRRGWRFVHFSTDYVFGGEARNEPYSETDRPAPLNFYGMTKLMGEQAVVSADPQALVLRVAHLFGGEARDLRRSNLVLRFLQAGDEGRKLKASGSQTLNPTSVTDVVTTCTRLLEHQANGIFHVTGGGHCTALEFAREVLRLAGLPDEVSDGTEPRPAVRPAYSVLDNARLRAEGYPELPHWRVALEAYLRRIGRLHS